MRQHANVEVKPSAIKDAGRGLFATREVAAGEIVVSVNRPFVTELLPDRMEDTCAWCIRRDNTQERAMLALLPQSRNIAALSAGTEEIAVKACTGCHHVKYCSKTCQSKAWKLEHKHECKILSTAKKYMPDEKVRCVVKLLRRINCDVLSEDKGLREILTFLPATNAEMMRKMKQTTPERHTFLMDSAELAWEIAGKPMMSRDAKYGLTCAEVLMVNVVCNMINLSCPLDDIPLAVGFDLILCSANHSCEPNAVFIFNQPTSVFRALRPISAGEEITIKYIDETNPFSVRQKELQESYLFSCRCTKCRKGSTCREDRLLKSGSELDADFVQVADFLIARHQGHLSQYFLPVNDPTAQRRVAAIQAEAFSVSGRTFDESQGNDEVTPEQTIDALKLCLNSGLWSWDRQPVPHLLRQLLVSLLKAGQTWKVWRIAVKLHFQCTRIMHPQPFYPGRSIDLWLLATLTSALGQGFDLKGQEGIKTLQRQGMDPALLYFGFLFEVYDNCHNNYSHDSPFGKAVGKAMQQALANVHLGLDELRAQIKPNWDRLPAYAETIDIFE